MIIMRAFTMFPDTEMMELNGEILFDLKKKTVNGYLPEHGQQFGQIVAVPMDIYGLTEDKKPKEGKIVKRKIINTFIFVYISIFTLAVIFFTAWRIEFIIQEKLTEKYGCEFKMRQG